VIVVAGEALVDLLVQPDGSIAAVPGGGPYNTARAIARLGPPVAWLGGLSSDRFGRLLETGLVADGVALQLIQRTHLPTTLALAELDVDGRATYRFYSEGTAASQVSGGVALPAGTRAVHVGSLGLVLEPIGTTVESLVAALPDDVLLMVDPNCRPSITGERDAYLARLERVLRRADILKASREDLAYLRPDEQVADAARWVASLGPRAVIVTDGAAPVTVLADGVMQIVEVPRVEVADTIGAGDTFGGAALAWLAHEGSTRATFDVGVALGAARFGVRAAAIACTRPGADPPTLPELGGWTSG
jgi:fructokinase